MPDIEIGRNRKGDYAILKVTRNDPVYSEDEIIGLEGYKNIGVIHVPSKCKVVCGTIEKKDLLEAFLQRESTTNIKKFLTQG